MTTLNQSIISDENYEEIKHILLAADEGSVTIGMTILEEADFDKSKIFLLCMLKEVLPKIYKTKGPFPKFESEYPVLFDKIVNGEDDSYGLKQHSVTINQLNLKKIYEIAIDRKNRNEISFLFNLFKDELMKLINGYGLDFLQYVDVVITPKTDIEYVD